MKKAWRIKCAGFPDGIAAAETRGQAIAIAHAGAREVGYQIAWKDIRATRAPQYDEWAKLDESSCAWGEEFLTHVTQEK